MNENKNRKHRDSEKERKIEREDKLHHKQKERERERERERVRKIKMKALKCWWDIWYSWTLTQHALIRLSLPMFAYNFNLSPTKTLFDISFRLYLSFSVFYFHGIFTIAFPPFGNDDNDDLRRVIIGRQIVVDVVLLLLLLLNVSLYFISLSVSSRFSPFLAVRGILNCSLDS